MVFPYDAEEKADKALDEIIEVVESLNIKYFLWGGTCLGFVRDCEYIEKDTDIDIVLDCHWDEQRFQKLTQALIARGFKPGWDGKRRFFQGWHQVFFKYDVLFDIWFKFSKPEKYQRFLESVDTVVYKGKEYNVPHPVRDYLSAAYGNWKVRVVWPR